MVSIRRLRLLNVSPHSIVFSLPFVLIIQRRSAYSFNTLYLAGFAQGGGLPHAGLIIPGADMTTGYFVHIRIGNDDTWKFEQRLKQKIVGSISFTNMLSLRAASAGPITPESLESVARRVPVPEGGENGECIDWVLAVVQLLSKEGHLRLTSATDLRAEFLKHAADSKGHATSGKPPNVKVSSYCS